MKRTLLKCSTNLRVQLMLGVFSQTISRNQRIGHLNSRSQTIIVQLLQRQIRSIG